MLYTTLFRDSRALSAILFWLRYLHNAIPPDLELVVLQPPALWFNWIGLALVNELCKYDPQLRNRLRAATAHS